MTVTELKKRIKENNIGKLYLFYGPETYLISYYIDKLKKAVVAEGTEDFNLSIFEGISDQGKVRDACDTYPFLSERKLIIWKNTGVFKKSTEEKTAGLIDVVSNVPEYACLVICEEEIDKRFKRIINAVESAGQMVEFPVQNPNDLYKWIAGIMSEEGRQIESKAAYLLIEYCDSDMGSIKNEIDKLIMHSEGNGTISGSDIEKVCIKSLGQRIFDLVDAIGMKRTERAVRYFNEMVQMKEPVSRILYMIAKQMRQILEVRALKQSGTGNETIASMIKVPPFVVRKLYDQSRSFSESELIKAVKMCLDTEISIKTGKISDDKTALELLITEIGPGGQV